MSPPGESAGERTEKATPKKRRDARERGQVLKSTEVNTAITCAAMFGFMLIFCADYIGGMMELIYRQLGDSLLHFTHAQVNVNMIMTHYAELLIPSAEIMLPLLLCAVIAGVAANLVQVGFLFTTKNLAPKLERISPIKGFKRIFSAKTVSELVKCILKVVCLGFLLYNDYTALLEQLPSLMGTEVYTSFLGILETTFRMALKMTLVLAILSVFDYAFQWWSYEKDLRMTKQEIKDEYKLTEGDPQIKGRIRQKQRQMSAMRMMQQVPQADVVITNPTHYAIALKYTEGIDSAPRVLAKGQDFLARKIKEVAREHEITMVENKPLAQSLYMYCEIGSEIPPDFYQAVADILVFVYMQKNKYKEVRR